MVREDGACGLTPVWTWTWLSRINPALIARFENDTTNHVMSLLIISRESKQITRRWRWQATPSVIRTVQYTESIITKSLTKYKDPARYQCDTNRLFHWKKGFDFQKNCENNVKRLQSILPKRFCLERYRCRFLSKIKSTTLFCQDHIFSNHMSMTSGLTYSVYGLFVFLFLWVHLSCVLSELMFVISSFCGHSKKIFLKNFFSKIIE